MRTNLFFMNIFISPLQTTNILWLTLCHCISTEKKTASTSAIGSQSTFCSINVIVTGSDQKWNTNCAFMCLESLSPDKTISLSPAQPIVANKHLAQCLHFFFTLDGRFQPIRSIMFPPLPRCVSKFIYYSHIYSCDYHRHCRTSRLPRSRLRSVFIQGARRCALCLTCERLLWHTHSIRLPSLELEYSQWARVNNTHGAYLH